MAPSSRRESWPGRWLLELEPRGWAAETELAELFVHLAVRSLASQTAYQGDAPLAPLVRLDQAGCFETDVNALFRLLTLDLVQDHRGPNFVPPQLRAVHAPANCRPVPVSVVQRENPSCRVDHRPVLPQKIDVFRRPSAIEPNEIQRQRLLPEFPRQPLKGAPIERQERFKA